MDDQMVANLALLVAKDAGDALDRRLAELDEEFGKRLNFRCIGPLPPYSFATVEVSLPSFETIDRARRILSLGERAGLADIKSAYRRRIRQVHPDLSSAVAGDGSPAARLTDAYKTLMNYAAALPLAAGAAGAAAGWPAPTLPAKPHIASTAARSRVRSWWRCVARSFPQRPRKRRHESRRRRQSPRRRRRPQSRLRFRRDARFTRAQGGSPSARRHYS